SFVAYSLGERLQLRRIAAWRSQDEHLRLCLLGRDQAVQWLTDQHVQILVAKLRELCITDLRTIGTVRFHVHLFSFHIEWTLSAQASCEVAEVAVLAKLNSQVRLWGTVKLRFAKVRGDIPAILVRLEIKLKTVASS